MIPTLDFLTLTGTQNLAPFGFLSCDHSDDDGAKDNPEYEVG